MLARISCALVSALAVSLSVSTARGQDRPELPPLGTEATPTTPAKVKHLKYGGQRKWIDSYSAADQALLAKLILQYTSQNTDSSGFGEVVRIHAATMTTPSLKNVHRADYSQLFSWHRTYIAGLESYLKAQGYSKFVPLPKWDPATRIPRAFGVDASGKSLIDDYNPQIDWSAYQTAKLATFGEEVRKGTSDTTPAAQVLADTLVVTHNNTHNTIGGTMASMSSPSVPIFWLYHSFIDDVGYDYEHLPKPKGMPSMTAAAPRGGQGDDSGEQAQRLHGTLRVIGDDNGVVLDTPNGPVALDGKPELLSALMAQKGRSVWLDALDLGDGRVTVTDVLAESTTMDRVSVRSDTPSDPGFGPFHFGFLRGVFGDGTKETGKIQGMDEVKVVGEKDGWLEVVVNDKTHGFVEASKLAVGDDTKAPSQTHGMTGSMGGVDMKGMDTKGGCCDGSCCKGGDCSKCGDCKNCQGR